MGIFQTLASYLTDHPQPLKTPSSSLRLAQHAPLFLSSSASTSDTQETWYVYEQLLLACLRTEDDHSARLCLQRLGDRFGADSARVQALTGLFDEATALDKAALEEILERYTIALRADPTNTPIEKRRIALLESLGRPEDAISALTKLLAHSPTDAEAWSHLASLYRAQRLYPQSIFCLEEVLLVHPNAYNIHARLGETTYIAANGDNDTLTDSIRFFCRSVELCEWYLRGWYGLRLVTDRVLSSTGKGGMDRKKVEGLNVQATEKLAEILRRAGSGEIGWQGFDAAELEAARELIENQTTVR